MSLTTLTKAPRPGASTTASRKASKHSDPAGVGAGMPRYLHGGSAGKLMENRPVYGSLRAAREALRDLVFVQGRARRLLGELGNQGEFKAGIASVVVEGTRAYGIVGLSRAKGDAADVSVTFYRNVARATLGPTAVLEEIVHSHPSGLRNFLEYGAGTEELSPPDRQFVVDEGVPLGLLTPTGAMEVLRPGAREPDQVLEGVPQKRSGRTEYVPDRPDLRELIGQEVQDISDEERTSWAEADAEKPRKRERKIRGVERRRERAEKKLGKLEL